MPSRARSGPVAATAMALAVCLACGSRTELASDTVAVAPNSGPTVTGTTDAALPPAADAATPPDAASPCASQGTVVLASGETPIAITLDDSFVYLLDGDGDPETPTLVKVPKCGGTAVTLAVGLAPGWGLAVDDTDVYFTLVPSGDLGNGSVVRVSKAGGPMTVLASGVDDPLYVAVDDTSVYWTSPSEGVTKVPKGGGATTKLASSPFSYQLAVDATDVVWVNEGTVPGGVESILSLAKAGGTPSTLASSNDFFWGLTLDATQAIWSSKDANDVLALRAVPLAGGASSILASFGVDSLGGIATDGANVYFTDQGNGNAGAGFLGSVSVQGGASVTLASALSGPLCVAVDATSVYWAASGNVMKGPK